MKQSRTGGKNKRKLKPQLPPVINFPNQDWVQVHHNGRYKYVQQFKN